MPVRLTKIEHSPDVVKAVRDAVHIAGQSEAERMVDYTQRGVQTSARARLGKPIPGLAGKVHGVPVAAPEEWLQAIDMEFNATRKGFKFTVGMFPDDHIEAEGKKITFNTLAALYEYGSSAYGLPARPVWNDAWRRFLMRVDKWVEKIGDAVGKQLEEELLEV